MRMPSEKVISALAMGAIGLRQHPGESLDHVQLGSVAHAAPGLDSSLSRALFQIDLGKFLGDRRMAQGQFLS
jgi:hypothetical protein